MKVSLVFAALALASVNLKAVEADEYYGAYTGDVQTKWLADNRRMELLTDFVFTDPNNIDWHAKKGRIIDGASIPRFLWSFVGSPFTEGYRNASVIHDIACDDKTRTWEVVHLAFYYAMRASGVGSIKSKIMYAGVYHFGPRWPTKKIVTKTVSTKIYKEKRVSTCEACLLPEWEIIRVPEIVTSQIQEEVLVAPASKTITEDEFQALSTLIEASASAGEEITLEDIHRWQLPNQED